LFLDCPGPSLHITAAATSLTSFINVSGQPKSRKREEKLFPAKSYMPRRYRIFGRFFDANDYEISAMPAGFAGLFLLIALFRQKQTCLCGRPL
jgi:hypothetical protein